MPAVVEPGALRASPGSNVRRALLVAPVWLSLAGCAHAPPPPPPPLLGTFGASGGLLGTWSTTANACYSGVSVSSWGTNATVRFVHERGRRSTDGYELATGTISGRLSLVSVQRRTPFREIELKAEQCARFDVAQHPQPDGTLGADVELDCDTGDGGRVIASIHAAACQ